GRTMTALLTAGRTTSKVHGKTLTNEEAGSPSFQGTQPANDPLFAALSKERPHRGRPVAPSDSTRSHWRQGRSVQSPVSETMRRGCGTKNLANGHKHTSQIAVAYMSASGHSRHFRDVLPRQLFPQLPT